MPGGATQVFSREFDAVLARLPVAQRTLLLARITGLGQRLASSPHYRMTGRGEYRLRVGDYRVIYDFEVARNELYLLTLGHRREVYR